MSWSVPSSDLGARKFNKSVRRPMRISSSTINRFPRAPAVVIESSPSKGHQNRSAVPRLFSSKRFVNLACGAHESRVFNFDCARRCKTLPYWFSALSLSFLGCFHVRIALLSTVSFFFYFFFSLCFYSFVFTVGCWLIDWLTFLSFSLSLSFVVCDRFVVLFFSVLHRISLRSWKRQSPWHLCLRTYSSKRKYLLRLLPTEQHSQTNNSFECILRCDHHHNSYVYASFFILSRSVAICEGVNTSSYSTKRTEAYVFLFLVYFSLFIRSLSPA